VGEICLVELLKSISRSCEPVAYPCSIRRQGRCGVLVGENGVLDPEIDGKGRFTGRPRPRYVDKILPVVQ
jgi:hypothetical protein